MARTVELDRLKALKDTVSVVGVGESSYLQDYRAGAKGNATEKGSGAMNSYQLAATALKRALDDAGLTKDDIDGFVTASGSPGGVDYDEFTAHTGLQIRWTNQFWAHGRWGSSSLVNAAMAIQNGLANYVLVALACWQGFHRPELS